VRSRMVHKERIDMSNSIYELTRVLVDKVGKECERRAEEGYKGDPNMRFAMMSGMYSGMLMCIPDTEENRDYIKWRLSLFDKEEDDELKQAGFGVAEPIKKEKVNE
jgi:hypothetical protein